MRLLPPDGWSEVAGIFVGGCVDRGEGSSFRARAHAHNYRAAPNYGWICVRSEKRLGVWLPMSGGAADGAVTKPSRLLWHEYAHILTPQHGHDDAWRETMRRLGQPIPARYQKKQRA